MTRFQVKYTEALASEGIISKTIGTLGLAGALAMGTPHSAEASQKKATGHHIVQHTIKPLPMELIRAINQVEASGRKINVPDGDHGAAKGPMQIHKPYWLDAVEYDPSLKKMGEVTATWDSVKNYDYAVKVVNAYMNRYMKSKIGSSISDTDVDAIVRKHNGGGDPNYVSKIHKALNTQK